jgi:hypothetical protein
MDVLIYGLYAGTAAGFLISIAYWLLKNRETAAFYTIGFLILGPLMASPVMEWHFGHGSGQSWSGGVMLGLCVGLGFATTLAEAVRRFRGRDRS